MKDSFSGCTSGEISAGRSGHFVKDSLSLTTRALGAAAGFLGGGILGIIVLVLAMVLARSDFGLDSIRPEALVSAIVGAIVGFFAPKRALKVLGKD
jgi:LytS/YehU family sensor histidine kinase